MQPAAPVFSVRCQGFNYPASTRCASVLCRLLRGDERNFQAWAYWRALTKKMGLPPEELLEYATSKIEVCLCTAGSGHRRLASQSPLLASQPQEPANQGEVC